MDYSTFTQAEDYKQAEITYQQRLSREQLTASNVPGLIAHHRRPGGAQATCTHSKSVKFEAAVQIGWTV
jgi:hypothetical protein